MTITPKLSRKEMLEKAAKAPNGKKYCPACDRYRLVRFFPIHSGHPGPYCKPCAREANHRAGILRKFNLTVEQYNSIYEAQGGRCAICQVARGLTRKLAVDHDHKTGLVRGLLCVTCNRMVLGRLRDSVDALQRAIDYLQNPPAQQVLGAATPVVKDHVPSQRTKKFLPPGDLRRIED